MTVRADEAQVIREATTAMLAGRTLASVARELKESGRRRMSPVRRKRKDRA